MEAVLFRHADRMASAAGRTTYPAEVHLPLVAAMRTAMSAGNLALLGERFPDRTRLHIRTAGDNGAKHAGSRELGFRVVERLHEFQRRAPGA